MYYEWDWTYKFLVPVPGFRAVKKKKKLWI